MPCANHNNLGHKATLSYQEQMLHKRKRKKNAISLTLDIQQWKKYTHIFFGDGAKDEKYQHASRPILIDTKN